jgi:hypothetical protein
MQDVDVVVSPPPVVVFHASRSNRDTSAQSALFCVATILFGLFFEWLRSCVKRVDRKLVGGEDWGGSGLPVAEVEVAVVKTQSERSPIGILTHTGRIDS